MKTEEMSTFPVEIESDELWALFEATIPDGQTKQETFQQFVRERIHETLNEEFIEANPKFSDRHLDAWRSVAEDND